MSTFRTEQGFSLIEVLVAIALFSVLSVGFYQVMFSGIRGSDTTSSVTRISSEARLGFNRMVRDTREGDVIAAADSTHFQVLVDFNNDTFYDNPTLEGDYEDLTFAYDTAAKTITLNGEILMSGVEPLPGQDIFEYSSNVLAWDWGSGGDPCSGGTPDGVVTWEELDCASASPHGIIGVGNNNRGLVMHPDVGELPHITNVTFAMRVSDGDRTSVFHAEAQLRNLR